MGSDKGVKYDTEKPRMDLVMSGFARALECVGDVGTFGATKYTDNGWQSVDNGIERYLSAMIRHYLKYRQGEYYDTDSELPHLSHMAWNALAVLELSERSTKPEHECKCGECNCHSDKTIGIIDRDDIRSIMCSFYGYDDIE